jgi:2-methylcitrate dehydratase PrpD
VSHAVSSGGVTLAQTLGTFAAEFATSQLPALALERAKMSLASTFSSAAMGVSIDSARIIRELERSLVSHGTSSLWFESGRLPADRAARVNALASDAAASDDSDMRSIAHIGTIVSSTGVAMAERLGSAGREVLAAMVLGYEVAGRVDEALTPGRMQRGFHGSVSTIFGGAVTTGRLLGLDAHHMAQAIAIAATSAGGMAIAADTSCAREYHAGLAAQLGVQAALAAQAGFEAELHVLEAPRGFFEAFNGQAVSEVSQGLGESWDIVTDMAVKLIPGAHPFHAIAEAAWTAAIEHDLAPEQIRRAIISAPQLKVWAQQAVQPHDLIGAAHSVPYFVASALVDRRFGWDHFSLDKMRDPHIAAMLARVSFDPDPPPHPDRFPHRHGGTVTLELMDGRVIRSTCQAPRGSGARGIDWADVDDKYRQLMPASGLPARSIDDSLALIRQLDSQSSLEPLMALISPRAGT